MYKLRLIIKWVLVICGKNFNGMGIFYTSLSQSDFYTEYAFGFIFGSISIIADKSEWEFFVYIKKSGIKSNQRFYSRFCKGEIK